MPDRITKKWFSFKDIPENYFFELCGCPFLSEEEKQSVNVFDEVSTLQGITRKSNKEWMRPTYTRIASLYSLFKKGYITLIITGDESKDTGSGYVLFCPDSLTKTLLDEGGNIAVEYNFDCIFSELRKSHPYYNLSVFITAEGNSWLQAMGKKYPELFETQTDISPNTGIQAHYPVELPKNYSKKGTYSWATSFEPEVYTEE